ncbi:hypothetical protein GYMLUDRAFT_40984, partial [Collybiopsis luxurians FD-317 M1]
MTPEEQHIIASYASTVYINTISFIIVQITGFGVSALGMLIATHILLTKSLTHSRIALLACLIVSFSAFTWSTFCNGAFPLIQEQVDFVQIKPKGQGGLEVEAQISNNKTLPLNHMQGWAFAISVLLSDFIVVWRVWILFQPKKLWRVTLILLTTVNIGIQIADCILDVIDVKAEESNSNTILDW